MSFKERHMVTYRKAQAVFLKFVGLTINTKFKKLCQCNGVY